MSNALRIGNRSISYEQAKEMLFPELIPQKGNEAMLSTVPHEGRTLHCKRRQRMLPHTYETG